MGQSESNVGRKAMHTEVSILTALLHSQNTEAFWDFAVSKNVGLDLGLVHVNV